MGGRINNLKYKSVVFDNSESEDEEDAGNDCGLSLEKLNLGPGKKLLVLCLGGFLNHRVYRHDKPNIPKYRPPDASHDSYLVYKRPFCDGFLKFCFERFEVGLWSSSNKWNIDKVLDCAMNGVKDKLLFVRDQTRCTDTGFKALEKKDKPIILKESKKLWEDKECRLLSTGQYSSSNTLLLDDMPYKSLLNPPNTAIFPRQYKADHVNDTTLVGIKSSYYTITTYFPMGPKGDLGLYLDGLADADDVPSYVEKHPFGQPAITSSHPDWDYYCNIIRKFQRG